MSDKYIMHNVNIIYTKNINYLVKSLQVNKQLNQNKKLNDNSLEFYINTKIINTEDIVQNILLSKIEISILFLSFHFQCSQPRHLHTQ